MAGGLFDDDDECGASAVEHVDGGDDVEAFVVEDACTNSASGAEFGCNPCCVCFGVGTEKDDGFLAGKEIGEILLIFGDGVVVEGDQFAAGEHPLVLNHVAEEELYLSRSQCVFEGSFAADCGFWGFFLLFL